MRSVDELHRHTRLQPVQLPVQVHDDLVNRVVAVARQPGERLDHARRDLVIGGCWGASNLLAQSARIDRQALRELAVDRRCGRDGLEHLTHVGEDAIENGGGAGNLDDGLRHHATVADDGIEFVVLDARGLPLIVQVRHLSTGRAGIAVRCLQQREVVTSAGHSLPSRG